METFLEVGWIYSLVFDYLQHRGKYLAIWKLVGSKFDVGEEKEVKEHQAISQMVHFRGINLPECVLQLIIQSFPLNELEIRLSTPHKKHNKYTTALCKCYIMNIMNGQKQQKLP